MSQNERSRLLVTSGDGPRECRRAVALVVQRLEREAPESGLRFTVTFPENECGKEPASALVTLTGNCAEQFARRWMGTVQWICASPFRPNHKRQNWFIGVYAVATVEAPEENPQRGDLRIETFRSGGPGGQHQNTTDSGVRITHLPSGISAVSTDERSQHRNRQVALERLSDRFFLRHQEMQAREKAAQNMMHKQLERGNPVRIFKGPKFTERGK
ncbi:MAG: peptide chain release factor H [Pseudomonadota bacterium]